MNGTRTRVKFCGMAYPEDIDAAVALGADALGFIFAPSPRRLNLDIAERLIMRVPPFVTTVGVFVNPDDELYTAVAKIMPNMIPQFCGDELPERCLSLARGPYLKVIHIDVASTRDRIAQDTAHYDSALPVFDSKIVGQGGGSGIIFDWSILPSIPLQGVVAGGLTASNVADCIAATQPFAVDVRSGIETSERKDYYKMHAFLEAVRRADTYKEREYRYEAR